MPVVRLSVRAPLPDDDRGEYCAMVSLSGRASIGDCAWFRQLLEIHAAQGPGRIMMDLSGLSFMDWWSAQILLWVDRVVSRRGGTLEMTSAQPAVARLLGAQLTREPRL